MSGRGLAFSAGLRLSLFRRLICLLAACWPLPSAADASCQRPADAGFSARATSSGGRYRITLSSVDLGLNRPARLSIAVARSDGGAVEADLRIRLRLLMTAHEHSMTTRPVLTRTGPAAFEAQGILLHMPGEWTIFLDVVAGGATEKVEACVSV